MESEDRAVEKAAQAASAYIGSALNAPLAEFGLLIRDKISYWRFKNQVNTSLKAKAFLESKGVDPQKIAGGASAGLVVPLLEAAGEASDESLSQMFANLLAAAIDPQTAPQIHPSFGKVLNQLSTLDAQILNALFSEVFKSNESNTGTDSRGLKYRKVGYQEDTMAAALKLDLSIIRLSFENLKRLGICDEGNNVLARVNKLGVISLTDYGFSFMRACTEYERRVDHF